MARLRRIDPIFIYALLGLILYVVLDDRAAQPEMVGEINVNRNDLLQHIQFRERRFDRDWVENYFAQLSAQDRQQLIEDFTGEEALVREARRLGLDKDDFVIRQRLIQKMNFIDIDPAAADQPSTAILEAWFDERADRYHSPARMSFTHIFFASESNQSVDDITAMRKSLNANSTAPAQALPLGERFAYLRSYQDRGLADLKSHFGADFVAALSAHVTEQGRWLGPLASRWGQHLVFIESYTPDRSPSFAELQSKVLYDWQQEAKLRAEQSLAQRAAAKYIITIADDVR
jgi:hypothetical protein